MLLSELYIKLILIAPPFFSLAFELLMDRNFLPYLHIPSTYVYLFYKYILNYMLTMQRALC